MGTTTRAQLTKAIQEQAGFSKHQSTAFVDAVFEMISDTLEQGEDVKLARFGTFRVRQKTARVGRNPKTSEVVEISARKVVTFKASHILRERVDGDRAGS